MLKSTFSIVMFLAQAVGAQDTLVVRADNPPVWGTTPSLLEEVRIGTLAGEEEYSFGEVGGLAVMPDGSIWIGDEQLGVIRRFNADGVFLGQVGRKGEGPGEFMYPSRMRILPDGSVAVWDPGRLRMSLFDTAGVFLHSFHPATIMIAMAGRGELQVDPNGNLYLAGVENPFGEGNARRSFWIRMRPNGEVLDSVFIVPGLMGEGTMDGIHNHTVLSPLGYLVTARNHELALYRPAGDGRVLRVERSWDPVPYQRAERAEKERLERSYSRRNGISVRRIPRYKPPFSTFEVDAEGRFWIQMFAPGFVEPETSGEREIRERYQGFLQEWRQPLVFEVIEPSGRYLGRLQFPNRQTDVVAARGHRIWAVEKGPYDEAYVVRYLIRPGG